MSNYDNPVQAQYDALTPVQKDLDAAVMAPKNRGRNLRDVLVEADGTPEDKAAVAEFLGGPGADAEFLNGATQ